MALGQDRCTDHGCALVDASGIVKVVILNAGFTEKAPPAMQTDSWSQCDSLTCPSSKTKRKYLDRCCMIRRKALNFAKSRYAIKMSSLNLM
eukprot:6576269-Pyramimonas_sp.AAC.1